MKTQLDQLQKQIKEKSIEFEQVEKKLQNQVKPLFVCCKELKH